MNVRTGDLKIEELARKLAEQTGEDPTQAVIRALEERLERNTSRRPQDREARRAAIMEIVERFSQLPVLDSRSPDEIIGYNEHGHFD
jgi:antitoxin VapB